MVWIKSLREELAASINDKTLLETKIDSIKT